MFFSLEPEDIIQDIVPDEARKSKVIKQLKLIVLINNFIIYISLHKEDLLSPFSGISTHGFPPGYPGSLRALPLAMCLLLGFFNQG